VAGQYSDLLEKAGVDTVTELALRKAEHLHQKVMEVIQQHHLVRQLPGLKRVENWILQAKKMPRVVNN
jgi:hypothetical protein